jgi:hypothetical protein
MAAADVVDMKGDPPPALVTAWKCQRWGTLPNAGGLRDQPVRLMRDMTACENVYNAMKAWHTAKNWAQFSKDNREQWRIVSEILKRRRNAR